MLERSSPSKKLYGRTLTGCGPFLFFSTNKKIAACLFKTRTSANLIAKTLYLQRQPAIKTQALQLHPPSSGTKKKARIPCSMRAWPNLGGNSLKKYHSQCRTDDRGLAPMCSSVNNQGSASTRSCASLRKILCMMRVFSLRCTGVKCNS